MIADALIFLSLAVLLPIAWVVDHVGDTVVAALRGTPYLRSMMIAILCLLLLKVLSSWWVFTEKVDPTLHLYSGETMLSALANIVMCTGQIIFELLVLLSLSLQTLLIFLSNRYSWMALVGCFAFFKFS
jgi:hypothetical protein